MISAFIHLRGRSNYLWLSHKSHANWLVRIRAEDRRPTSVASNLFPVLCVWSWSVAPSACQ